MSEPLPPTTPEPAPSSPSPEPAKAKWPLSRTILLAILAVCLAALGFDYLAGRRAQEEAYRLLRSKLPNDSREAGGPVITEDKRLVPEEVHKLLGREPDSVVNDPKQAAKLMQDQDAEGGRGLIADLVEVYRFPGALQYYVVRVAYLKEAGTNAFKMSDLNSNTQSRFSGK